MSIMTKKKTKYVQVPERNYPQLVTRETDSEDNSGYKILERLILKTLDANNVFLFKRNNDQLSYCLDNSWSYQIQSSHPLIKCFKNKGLQTIDNPQDNLLLKKDQVLKSKISYAKELMWTYSTDSYFIVISSNKSGKINLFQLNFLRNLSDYINFENKNIEISNISYLDNMASVIIQAISKKDTYTGGHTRRVGMFAEMICDELDCDDNFKKEVSIAAIIHDVGKIGIPDHILKKNSPLTDDEYEIMKQHPALGMEILKKVPGFENISKGVCFHHERPDGKGYPYGLKGDEIPLIALIVSLSDAFDAMISTRPYRKAISPDEAFDMLKKFRGTQFDKRVFDAFEKAFLNSNISRKYRDIKKVS